MSMIPSPSPEMLCKINEAKALGWDVSDHSFFHPHNNDYVESFYFKSPRMTRYSALFESTDLKRAEASSIALDFIKQAKSTLDGRSTVDDVCDFFLRNQDATSDTIKMKFILPPDFIS